MADTNLDQAKKEFLLANYYSKGQSPDFQKINSLSASTRSYYRAQKDEGTEIICVDPLLSESRIKKYEIISQVLKNVMASLPELRYYDLKYHLLIWDDLGEMNLAEYLKMSIDFKRNLQDIHQRYIIPFFVKISQQGTIKEFPVFSLEKYLFEWEFHVNSQYICSHLKKMLRPDFWEICLSTMLKLFYKLLQAPVCPIHRDFQSSNIFIKNDKMFLIDAQDMRMGHPLYDPVSWYFDSYLPLKIEDRFNYLDDYINHHYRQIDPYRDAERLSEEALILIIQRKLHDAGAFVFADSRMGGSSFSGFIQPALYMAYEAALRLNNEICIKFIHALSHPEDPGSTNIFL